VAKTLAHTTLRPKFDQKSIMAKVFPKSWVSMGKRGKYWEPIQRWIVKMVMANRMGQLTQMGNLNEQF